MELKLIHMKLEQIEENAWFKLIFGSEKWF